MIAYYFPRRAVIFHSILFAVWKDKSNVEWRKESYFFRKTNISRCQDVFLVKFNKFEKVK